MKYPLRALAAFGIPACAMIGVLLVASCSPSRAQTTTAASTGQRFELDLVPGAHYLHSAGFLFIKIRTYPQMACWIESPDGKYVGTIYVTAKVAKKKWFGAPSAGRPEALPVWSHARENAAPEADAVSGATPAGTVRVDSPLAARLSAGSYLVKLEVNSSFDYNERYTRANSGVNGQPSLVYAGRINVGTGETEADLVPIGTGSVDGKDGDIRPGLEGITTASEMLQSARILYHAR